MSDNWNYPTTGGTYLRDDATGALTRVEPPLPVDPEPPAPEIDAEADPAAAPVAQAAGNSFTGKNRKGTV